MPRATTAKEANEQVYKVPESFDEESELYNIDGYAIAQDLGFDLKEWGEAKLKNFQELKQWDLDELEIRLMLFYIGRLLHFTGYTYHEYDHEKDTLLRRLAELKGVTYQPLS